jgi:DNA-binding transcriptional MerR regulator
MRNVIFQKDKPLSIGAVCDLADINEQTLRNWEKNGLLSPQRVAGNQRIYLGEDFYIIEDLIKLKFAKVKRIVDLRKFLSEKYNI